MHNRDCQAQRTGAGNDQNGYCNKYRMVPVTAGYERPADKGNQRQQVHKGCVDLNQAVSNANITRFALFCCFHQVYHFRQEGLVLCLGDFKFKRSREVKHTALYGHSGGCIDGLAFSGHQRSVQFTLTACNQAIERDAFAGLDQYTSTDCDLGQRNIFELSVFKDDRSALCAHLAQAGDGSPRLVAHGVVQVATDQQKEQKGYGSVKIGFCPAGEAFINTHDQGKQHGQRYWDIHIESPHFQRCPR